MEPENAESKLLSILTIGPNSITKIYFYYTGQGITLACDRTICIKVYWLQSYLQTYLIMFAITGWLRTKLLWLLQPQGLKNTKSLNKSDTFEAIISCSLL